MTPTQILIAEIEAVLKPATKAELASYLGISPDVLYRYQSGRRSDASASRIIAWQAVLKAARRKKSRKSETR